LVGVVSPWNFPLLLASLDTVPALAAGAAVLVKPSELTPRFVEPLRASVAAVPELEAVLAFVLGGPEVGEAVVDAAAAVCFTGSVPTGRNVAERAARRLIPAFLELGGKDPAVVLASADLDQAAAALLWAGTVNAGQSCLSIERVVVERAVAEAFLERLVARAEAVELAYPELTSGPIGPIVAVRQAEVIREHLADARAHGARVLCGGEVEELGGGLYCRPTVIADVKPTMRVWREETFGPLLPVLVVDGAEAAVAAANASDFGLSAAVFAGSLDEAEAVAGRLEVGAVSLNDAGLTAMIHEGEKVAFKHSGLGGSRMGDAALRRFLRPRVHLSKTQPRPDPWWFGAPAAAASGGRSEVQAGRGPEETP
jgi:aldehyde dehydrogenase (NAD+)